MRIVPRASVRFSLIAAILITLVVSWVISSGVSNYINYLGWRTARKEMVENSGTDVVWKEPRFTIKEFFAGRPPVSPGDYRRITSVDNPPENTEGAKIQDENDPSGAQQRFHPAFRDLPRDFRRPIPYQPGVPWDIIFRFGLAAALAALAGVLLSRMFTKPLDELAKGAKAFQAGSFDYRIPEIGDNEFTAVASAMNTMATRVSEQIDDLEDEAVRRRRFLEDIAHEFRSPVTTMRTMAGALQDGLADVPERRDRAITSLVDTSDRLLRLVRDLMEFAKLNLNDFSLNIRRVDVVSMVNSLVQSAEPRAQKNDMNITFSTNLQELYVDIDPDRIAQVIDNVIQNAISYAGAGAEINVGLKSGDQVEIVVKDTGVGIAEIDMPYVVDPFYRADSARTPSDSHSGLGLSIASRLVDAHQGSLTIESKKGVGTTVRIRLPRV